MDSRKVDLKHFHEDLGMSIAERVSQTIERNWATDTRYSPEYTAHRASIFVGLLAQRLVDSGLLSGEDITGLLKQVVAFEEFDNPL